MILTLDTATHCGWAAGRPGERPIFGTRHFIVKGGNGEIITLFRHWLEARCAEYQPKLIVFESPYIPNPQWSMVPSNADTLRRLLAIAVQVEGIAWERRIRCAEVRPQEVAKFILGTGGLKRDEKKAATIKAIREYGFDVTDDHQADALSIWLMAEAKINPAAGRARGVGPLFLNPKNVAPRRRTPAGRGAVGRENGDPGAQQRDSFIGSAA